MTTAIDLITAGTVYTLNDLSNYKVLAEDGLGLPPLHRFEERGPLQHGVGDRGYRLDARMVTLVVEAIGTSPAQHYSNRRSLLNALSPDDSPVVLRYTLEDETQYQLDCFIVQGLSFPSTDRSVDHQKVGFTLKAPDPTFYSPSVGAETFQLGGGPDSCAVPTAIPMGVGASTLDSSVIVNYPGTWDSFPSLIRITGPVNNPIITNQTTGETLNFTGGTIPAGAYYDIDCRYGYKTVVDSSGVNRIAQLSEDSDLSTFHLQRNSGNSIRVQGSSVTAATKVEITYAIRYLGF